MKLQIKGLTLLSLALTAAPALFLMGCVPTVVEVGNSGTTVESTNAVCDPFGLAAAYGGRTNGLAAKLFYSPTGSPHLQTAASYPLQATPVDADLYFNQVNVPTRPYDSPFVSTTGRTIVNDQGEGFYEWFGIQMSSQIQLSDTDAPGLYQFAVLADDGAVLEVKQDPSNGQFETIVDNDGTHSTRMGCARSAVRMDYTTRMPMKLAYYQGPRYHIAIMLLWRQVPDTGNAQDLAASLQDSACGQSGNGMFFDSAQKPPRPTQTYLDMINRGWKVMRPGNFILPNGAENPCVGTGLPGGAAAA
ncbi:MAG: hypothetical protein H7222_01790 [Methylotenera sp.]|nr:hypothetical protein [Oligoflexia bacterium]